MSITFRGYRLITLLCLKAFSRCSIVYGLLYYYIGNGG